MIGVSLLAWLAAFGLALAASRERAGAAAARLLALSLVYLPLLLLAGAALEPSVAAERLLVMLGAPALAAADPGGARRLPGARVRLRRDRARLRGRRVAGSPLTQLSLVGPNPAAGHRFYGIGNELEAILAVLVIAGTGAALAGFAPGPSSAAARAGGFPRRRGVLFAFVFAAGRFGADVGAAIVLPLGAAVAAATCSPAGRASPVLALAVPLAGAGAARRSSTCSPAPTRT